MLTKVSIFTDGACRGNPGPGGWGALLIHQHYRKELYGAEPMTTNNRMELLAVIKALEAINKACHIVVTSDSKYVLQGMTTWLTNWKKQNWKTASKQPVKNQDLWQRLDELTQGHTIEWQWVKGHNGHPDNELVDHLANKAINELLERNKA